MFLITTSIFALFVLASGLSTSIAYSPYIAFSLVCSLLSNISNAPATILDTVRAYRGVSLGVYYSVPSAAAVLAALVGVFLVAAKGWRWTQWATTVVATAIYIPVCLTRETYKKVILQCAERNGLTQTSLPQALRYFPTTLVKHPLHMLATETIVTMVSLYNTIIFALIYNLVAAVLWIFKHYYSFDNTGKSLAFLGAIIGTLNTSAPLILVDLCFYKTRLQYWQDSHGERTSLPPEVRLTAALLGSFLLPASLFLVGWTANYRVFWIVHIIFQGMTTLSSMLIYASVGLYMMDAYGPLYAASASGAMMVSRYLVAAVFPLFALQMYKALGVAWATSMLRFLTLGMALVPWCFKVYKKRLRKRNKYEASI